MSQFTPTIKRVETKAQGKSKIKLGLQLLKEKRFEEAEVQLKEIIQENPASWRAHIFLGNLRYKQKNYSEALDHFGTAIRVEPLKIQGYLFAAKVYLKQKQLDGALEKLQEATKLDPKSPFPYLGMGHIYFARNGNDQEKVKDYAKSLDYFTKAVRLNPRLAIARQRLALVYIRQEKFSEAVAQIHAALRLENNNPEAHATLGQIYLSRQEYDAALSSFQTSIEQKSEASSSTRFGLIEALIKNERVKEAQATLEAMPETEKFAAIRHKLWGDIYHHQGLFKEAAEEYNAATLLGIEEASPVDEGEDFDILAESDNVQWAELSGKYKDSTQEALMQRRYQSLLKTKK